MSARSTNIRVLSRWQGMRIPTHVTNITFVGVPIEDDMDMVSIVEIEYYHRATSMAISLTDLAGIAAHA